MENIINLSKLSDEQVRFELNYLAKNKDFGTSEYQTELVKEAIKRGITA